MLIYLEKLLFYLLIFCLPFQTRKVLYIFEVDFNEWTSVYLYLTDILILSVLLLWVWRKRDGRFFKNGLNIKTPGFWLGAFLIVGLISLIQTRNIQLGFYHWIKLLEMLGLFFYLKDNLFKSGLRYINFRRIAQIFVMSGVIQSIIALGQYFNQKSLGLNLLAESPLSSQISGVAKITVDHVKMIRAYGTLPHANVLAAFLLVSIFFLYFLWLSKKHSFFNNLLMIISFWLLMTGLLLSFSRLIISVFLFSSILYFISALYRIIQTSDKELFKRIIFVFLLFTTFSLLLTVLAWPEISARFQISLTEQSVGLRIFYSQVAFSVIQEHPWLGIGFGNFVLEIRQMLNLLVAWAAQPVHNIYLLIASETGLIGLFLFFMFLYRLLKQACLGSQRRVVLFIVLCLLFLGLFDHFLWTLQQGQIMFWLILGIFVSMKNRLINDKPKEKETPD